MSKRKIPEWMKDLNHKENDETVKAFVNVVNEQNEEHVVCKTEPCRRLRSNNVVEVERKENQQLSCKVETRSGIVTVFPPIIYEGKIELFTELRDIAWSCDTLMQWVIKSEASKVPIAFDMEWPFTFQTGSGKTALIQVCADVKLCTLYHVFKLKKLPAALIALLAHKKVVLHGVNIKNDIRKLASDFPEVGTENSQIMLNQCIDLGVWYNEVYNSSGRWSLERLVHRVCKLQINKNKNVRMSKWNILPLSNEQKVYAAIDVYIGQVIYDEIKSQELNDERNIAEFLQRELLKEFNVNIPQ